MPHFHICASGEVKREARYSCSSARVVERVLGRESKKTSECRYTNVSSNVLTSGQASSEHDCVNSVLKQRYKLHSLPPRWDNLPFSLAPNLLSSISIGLTFHLNSCNWSDTELDRFFHSSERDSVGSSFCGKGIWRWAAYIGKKQTSLCSANKASRR